MKNKDILIELEQLKKEIDVLKSEKCVSGNNLKYSFRKKALMLFVVIITAFTTIFLYSSQISFTDGTIISAAEVNSNFTELYNSMKNVAPVGSIIAWNKSLSGTPSLPENWIECNGQTISDADSPYNGLVAPNINNENRFLRGNLSSGGTGGALTHVHTFTQTFSQDLVPDASNYSNGSSTDPADHTPPYFNVVWIMRIK